jgi:putative ABC transport system permease protein
MRALDKKLLRDFRRLWAQALAIALVLACGVAILLTTYGMYGALEDTRSAYYERNRFADVFADANRVPKSVLRDISEIGGVRSVEARISTYVILDLDIRVETVTGHILSLPENGAAQHNLPIVRSGRLPNPGHVDEVVVNEPFATANHLKPGDRFHANLNGQRRELTLTGTVLSPEFIYTIGPGALMPDNETFGILWMPERSLAAAYDMRGAFNNVTLKLDPQANEDAVITELDNILSRYGGTRAYGRDVQLSNSFIEAEIVSQRVSAMILPPVFYGVSAFLVGMVIARIIALERSEIGLLKSLGYSDVEVCIHYLLLASLIAVVGTLLGWSVGTWLSRAVAQLYAQFFDFPYLIYRVSLNAYAVSGILAIISASAGAAKSALSAARIPPAEAMSPPVPPRFRRTFLDRLLTSLRPSQSVMMILRSLMRWPIRSALTTLGLSLAAAVLVASSFFIDAMDVLMDTTFQQANRQDAVLQFSPDIPEAALASVAKLPGVIKAEGQLYQAVILRNGHLEKETSVSATHPGSDLARIVDSDGAIIDPPENGILLPHRLAAQLQVDVGDTIQMELKGGRNETFDIQVSGTVIQYFGLGAYMNADTLNRLLRQAPRVSVANLLIDTNQLPELHRTLKDTPELSGLSMLDDMRRSFEDTIQQNIAIMTTIYLVIAVLITFGVAYNGARIQLSERARELASLRILGFSKGEVSFILIGETMLLAILAQPLGWLLGAGIAVALAEGATSDLYAIPLVLEPEAFAQASLVVLGAALVSSLIVRRRLDRLDLIQVLKTRE